MRVLHLVNTALPTRQVGYTIRTHQIAIHQRAKGIDAHVAALDFSVRDPALARAYELDGVPHLRFAYDIRPGPDATWRQRFRAISLRAVGRSMRQVALLGREAILVDWFVDQARVAFANQMFDVIHAHSPYYCAAAAQALAEVWRIPWVYEVRGFWEESAVTQGYHDADSLWYRVRSAGETRALRNADHVFAIGTTARREITRRGVSEARISLAPNSVDAQRFVPGPRDPELVARYDLAGAPVLGYIGSMRELEGIDAMIEVLPSILQSVPAAKLVLVGGAEPEYQDHLERLVDRLGLKRSVVFAGRVPFDQVEAMYRLIDVFLVTRPDQPVTRMITPLKPLEALSAELPVVASKLEALEELVGGEPQRGVLVPPGDRAALAEAIVALIRDPSKRAALGRNGRAWVQSERTWTRLTERYQSAYEALRRPA